MPYNPLSRLLRRPEEAYVRPSVEPSESVESIASDATSPDNPGPGRNIGRLYDSLGAKVERKLRKGRGEHAQLSLQLFSNRFDSVDSIASDATAPNNPGPGRNLGLLLDVVGGKVERSLSSLAGRYKLGPQAIIDDIHHLRLVRSDRERSLRESTGVQTRLAFTNEERILLKKKCRKLLKYCRAQLLSTQIEALHAVTALAVGDPYVRQLLANVLHDSYLIPRYKERELYIACSKALISIKDNEVHEFWSHLSRYMKRPMDSHLKSKGLYKQLISYLKDPNISFLLGRLLQNLGPALDPHSVVVSTYMDVALANPDVIEEVALIKIFGESMVAHSLSVDFVMRLANYFPILRVYETGPASSQHLRHREGDLVDLLEDISIRTGIESFLGDLCRSMDLREQLLYLRNMDESARQLLRKTVFSNELLIVWAHMQHYSCADRVESIMSYKLEAAVTVMLSYYVYGDPDEQALAKAIISRSMEMSRYLRRAMNELLHQRIDTSCLEGLPSSATTFKMVLAPQHPLYEEHFHTLDHRREHAPIKRRSFVKNENIVYGENTDMNDADILPHSTCFDCFLRLYIWLGVDTEKGPFDASGHYPVLGGFNASGKELYLARVENLTTYVPDGAQNISIADSSGKSKKFNQFRVLVLKHDACEVGVPDIPAGANFQAGPAYWICDEEGVEEGDESRFSVTNLVTSEFSWTDLDASQEWDRIEELSETELWGSGPQGEDWVDRDLVWTDTDSEGDPITMDIGMEGSTGIAGMSGGEAEARRVEDMVVSGWDMEEEIISGKSQRVEQVVAAEEHGDDDQMLSRWFRQLDEQQKVRKIEQQPA